MVQKQAVRLIALDMDGTLLHSDQTVSERTQKAIHHAMDRGIHVVLCTGRGMMTCYPYAEQLGLRSYLVTANGGEIWTVEKKRLEQHLISADKIEKLWKLGKGIGVNMWMIATDKIFRNEAPADFDEYEWLKFGCQSFETNKLDEMVHQLSFFEGLELTNSLPSNVEVNPAGVTKANALHSLCRKTGITMAEIMACGDSLNDIKMIQESGIGVAMGNAQEAVKKAADVVTDHHDQDGVAKVIERFAL